MIKQDDKKPKVDVGTPAEPKPGGTGFEESTGQKSDANVSEQGPKARDDEYEPLPGLGRNAELDPSKSPAMRRAALERKKAEDEEGAVVRVKHGRVVHDGQSYGEGDEFIVTGKQANELVAAGTVEKV